ncbi:ABC transporter permease [Lysobacter soyae]|uniref:Transport permease protein n=1 Tax=Lysobacter soyae TaxID=2764185 RepID=A0ABX8WMY2_9GAMM|nr:ABC transporter permease [Lysobacter sp. CJ11]QYR52739.1 ABC transporter permease [Lysobacter sp. CJ11]
MMDALWRYRGFVWLAVINEYKARFVRSRFGLAWVVLNPLAQVLIYATVLSSVLATRLPGVESKFSYTAYLLSGMICWNTFSEIVSRSLTMFMDNSSLLKKVNFPRIALPAIVVVSALVGTVALSVASFFILLLAGFPLHATWIWLPVLIAITALFAVGVGLLAGTINVFSRDFGQVFAILLQFWFWLTPVVYPSSVLPERISFFAQFNPMYTLVEAFHSVVVFGRIPTPEPMLIVFVLACALLAFGTLLFRRASPDLVDEL